MTTTSAVPTNLEVFATTLKTARTTCVTNLSAAMQQTNAMIAACGGAGVASTNLSSLDQLLYNFSLNEQFVQTVHDELVAADHGGNSPASISDSVLLAALQSKGLAAAPPAVVVQPSEVFGVPPTSGFVDDPVCAANGNFVHGEIDLQFPGFTSALEVQRFYNSLATGYPGVFGPGWTSVLDVALTVAGNDEVRVRIADGATVYFHPGRAPREPWPANGRRDLSLVPTADGWDLVESAERRWLFNTDGVLWAISLGAARVEIERRGDAVVLSERRSGRSVTYRMTHVNGQRRVGETVSNDGRAVSYRYDRHGLLDRVSGPGGTADYELDGPLIRSLRDADGVVLFSNVYDANGRVVQQTSQFGRITDYTYGAAGSTVITDQFGVRNAMIHDSRGNLTAVVDTDGRAMRMTYDDGSRRTSVTDRDGNVWRYAFDPVTGDLLTRIDPDGRQASWTWDDQSRLLSSTDRGGGVTTYAYEGELRAPSRVVNPVGGVASAEHDERGYATRITDEDGVVFCFEWDRDGQVSAITDALGAVTTIEFDAAGLYSRMVDPVAVEVTVQRDPAGRILRHVVPDGASSAYRYSPAGRVVGGAEPGGLPWSAELGVHGKPISFTDGEQSTVGFVYDTNGQVIDVTAPDGAVYRNVFDEMGQLLDSVDPTGAIWHRRRDGNGNVVEFVDPTGARAERTVDAWGRTLVHVGPDGAMATFTYHANGGVASVTGPDGRCWTTEVDLCGHETAVIDPLGRRATITFSPAGRVLERRSPAGRSDRFEYDAAGRLSVVHGADGVMHRISRDARGQGRGIDDSTGQRTTWTLTDGGHVEDLAGAGGTSSVTRDERGFVRTMTGFDGATTSYEWNARGMMMRATDGAGASTSFDYDARGRLLSETAPGGAITSYGYDASGHFSRLSEPASGTTEYRRDPTGRVVGLRRADGTGWDATFDALGRTTSLVDQAGSLLTEVGYDIAGRTIANRSESGHDIGFLWDDNDTLIGLQTADDLRRYRYDEDGLVVAETDAAGHEITYVRSPSGAIERIVDSQLGDIAVPHREPPARDGSGRVVMTADGTAVRYDEAGRLAEMIPPTGGAVSYAYDDRGLLAAEMSADRIRRFAYDRAGRMTGIVDDPGGRSEFGYDSAGRRIAEHWSDGTLIQYRWNASDRLIEIIRHHPGGAVESTPLDLDGLGNVVAVGDIAVGWDLARTGLPDRVGGQRFVRANGSTLAVDSNEWLPAGERLRSSADVVGVTGRGHLAIGALVVLGVRVLDGRSGHFLTPDPLASKPGSTGAASPYTFAWYDPIRFVDPTGLRPISQEEFDAIRKQEEQGKFGQAWEAIKQDPWGAAGMALVAAAGVGLLFVPGGQAIGVGILIGVGTSAAMGIATGTFDPRAVALNGLVGGISGGAGAMATTVPRAILIGAATEGTGDLAIQLATGDGSVNWNQTLFATATGGLIAGGTQRLFPIGSQTDDFLPSGTTASNTPVRPPTASSASAAGPQPTVVTNSAVPRVPQDINVSPTAPDALPLNRPVSQSPTQNQFVQDRITDLQAQGATDIRVNQQQVDLNGGRVGTNRPDLQYSDANGNRIYEEFDTTASNRAGPHADRILANDPSGTVNLFTVD